jgi:hypothetical protein
MSIADIERAEQAKAAWNLAVILLKPLSEARAKAFFGKLLSEHGLKAWDMLPAVEAAIHNGTQDPKSFLVGAAKRAASRQRDPALACDWC